jgi:hypothetical protein
MLAGGERTVNQLQYEVQTTTNLQTGTWSNVGFFRAAQSTQSTTNAVTNPTRQF